MKPAHFLAALLLPALSAAPATSAEVRDPQLRADAGLGGLARPGRWMPVRVAIENGGDALNGDLVLRWGDARVRRAIALTPGARQRFELYMRTTEVQDLVRIAIETDGRDLSRLEVPIRIVRFDEPLLVCLGPRPDRAISAGGSCDAALTSESAPSSWRGYDAADDVVADDTQTALAADQQRAVGFWRAIRTLEDSGGISQPRDVEATDSVRPTLRLGFAIYLIALSAAFATLRLLRARPVWKYAATTVIVISATSTALAIGRGGPASAVTVRYAAIVHRFDSSPRSHVVLKGMAEFPGESRFEIRAPVDAGAFESRGARGVRDEQQYDANGTPTLAGRFGLGARKVFAFEGDDELAIVDASKTDRGQRVTNVSGVTLDGCRVRGSPVSFDDRPIGSIQPGASIDIAGAGKTRWLTCVMQSAALNFTAAGQPVLNDGRVQLFVELAPDLREP